MKIQKIKRDILCNLPTQNTSCAEFQHIAQHTFKNKITYGIVWIRSFIVLSTCFMRYKTTNLGINYISRSGQSLMERDILSQNAKNYEVFFDVYNKYDFRGF